MVLRCGFVSRAEFYSHTTEETPLTNALGGIQEHKRNITN